MERFFDRKFTTHPLSFAGGAVDPDGRARVLEIGKQLDDRLLSIACYKRDLDKSAEYWNPGFRFKKRKGLTSERVEDGDGGDGRVEGGGDSEWAARREKKERKEASNH